MANKLTGALAIVLFVAVAAATTIVSSAHGARTLETTTAERVTIPASFVASPPAVDDVDVDFDVPPEEEAAAADGPAAAGPDAWDWDDKTPVSGP
ncbi:hypothetical protein SEVIR_9G065550v4 [Setaria viridis]|uniref:Uncharacterized protein n=1 Tax=Setaria viridis TaxID=4556 RepID=A0A4U6SSK0_SETVI|nr:hypothetical protein SEVIR_9G065550v2 [Setaria viridis]